MGKASTAKKVARAAKAGGKKTGKTQRQLGFPIAIGVVVVLGLSLVAYARSSGTTGSDSKNHPQVGEHWHAAYGFYICDHFVANIPDGPTDTLGIHTHEDGLVHIHPFTSGAAGNQATFQKFFDQVGMKVTKSKITLPKASPFDGRTYEAGTTTCNGKPAVIKMAHWKSAVEASAGAAPTKVYTDDFGSVKFTEDLGAFTFAFVPAGTKIPPPPGAGDILKNATNDQSPSPTDASSTTTPGASLVTEPQGSTVPGSTTPATSAPATTAPATTAPATTTP